MNPLLRKAFLRLGVFCAYCVSVSWIFTIIERKDESAHERKGRMLKDLRMEIRFKYNMTDNDFDSFTVKAAAALSAGDKLDWTFPNSGAFVFAALTTVGYGHITPQTPLGQGITIIFCFFGIPITMLVLKTTGELLAASIKYLVLKTETVILKRTEPKHVKKKTFFVASALMVFLFISTGASAVYLENWTFIEGLYAWFTTFTTIGFGDFVPFNSIIRDTEQGKASKGEFFVQSLLFFVPYMAGLSLTSCPLSCAVESIDEIRDFRDRYMNCWPSFTSFKRKLFAHNGTSFNVTEEQNNETTLKKSCMSC